MSLRINERSDVARRGDRFASDENEMAADAERRRGAGKFDGVVERFCVGHKCSTGENSVAVRTENSFVNATGEAEIVSVEDELLGHRQDAFESERIISRKVAIFIPNECGGAWNL